MSNAFCPPPPILSEHQHIAAYYKWCLNSIVYDYLLAIKMYRDGDLTDISEKACWSKSNAVLNSLLLKLFDSEDSDTDAWDGMWIKSRHNAPALESFKQHMMEVLSDTHCGDCTSLAGTCSRCEAESLYDIPSSCSWKCPDGRDPGNSHGSLQNE